MTNPFNFFARDNQIFGIFLSCTLCKLVLIESKGKVNIFVAKDSSLWN